MKQLADYIRTIPDFPKPGILYRDITPLIESPAGFARAIGNLEVAVSCWGRIDKIAAPEARGFIFAAPLALKLGVGLVPVRKSGKLPFKTRSVSYSLEYGTSTLEIHEDAIQPGEKVLLLDDLLATGGTVCACRKLVELFGATVMGAAFVIELTDLKGREQFPDIPVFAPIQFAGE